MNLLSIKKERSILSLLLKQLGVNHTTSYTNKVYSEHPHKNNMFGLSRMLTDYGVENAGVRISDKDEITNLEIPFIAQIANDLVLVSSIGNNMIDFVWQGKKITTTIDEFKKSWSGVVLLVEKNEMSSEPDYSGHKKEERYKLLQKLILLSACLVLIGGLYMSNQLYNDLGLSLAILVNLGGVYIGYLLVLKQLHVGSRHADKICSLFKQSDCNDILESKVAKIGNVIGWSEIGLGYFMSNVIILLTMPTLIPYLAIISACALPYTIWSIWYQKFVAKTWCPLCLVIQAIFWVSFIIYLFFDFITIPSFLISDLLILGCIYLIPVLVINLTLPRLSKERKTKNIIYEMNSLKMKDEVFSTILKRQPYYKFDRSVSNIIWGNPDADILITILTNPHCNPCARMHTRIEDILAKNDKAFCVQYIFSSFNEELQSSSKCLISAYMNNSEEKRKDIFNDWFKEGKFQKDNFFDKYNLKIEDVTVEEHEKHQRWKDQTGLRATPTILVNGYQLPVNYRIEDLLFFTDLDVNTR